MTQEEAKEILISTLRDINSDSEGFECTTEQFTEAMLIAIEELSRPSLPSNLDDAVFAYEDSSECPSANQEEERMVYDAFKAGAKWMAEQGISCEAEAVKDVGISFLKGAFEKATKEFDGKVIVQIRKKEV